METRRYDLDWIRVLAILLLHFFHAAMPFVADWGWHIKNPETSNLFLEFNYFLSKWRMPVLFFISGIGTVYVLRQFSGRYYIWQRTKRLLLPLLFGMLVVVPPQVYFERIYDGAAFSSYFDFYPSIFTTGPYPKGNLSWHHLWFVLYLFVYSLMFVPIYGWLRSKTGQGVLHAVASLPKGWGLMGMGGLLCVGSLLYFRFPEETHALVDDWAGFTRYLLYFLLGGCVGTHTPFWHSIEGRRRIHLKLAFFSIIAIHVLRWNDWEPTWGWNIPNLLWLVLQVFNGWFWVLAILGYGKRYLNRRSRFLDYANEAIYPFYILHQTFIVMIAYYVVQVQQESILNKYLFLTLVSFVLSMGVYAFLIKPYNAMRLLFGMKPKRSQ